MGISPGGRAQHSGCCNFSGCATRAPHPFPLPVSVTYVGPVRTFSLQRDRDVSGVSGTGHVADGIEWSDGTVVLRWLTSTPTTTMHENIRSVEKVHLHDGATRILWGARP